MGKLKGYIISSVLGIVIGLLLFNSCDKNQYKDGEVILSTYSDTTYSYVTYVDTVRFNKYDTIYSYVDIESIYYDTVSNYNTYKLNHEDSLINLNISMLVDGVLVSRPNISYVPKFPKYINRVDTVFKNINTIITKKELINKRAIYLGSFISVSNNKQLTQVSPTISFKDKRGNMYHVGYDLYNKEYRFGYQRELKFK